MEPGIGLCGIYSFFENNLDSLSRGRDDAARYAFKSYNS